MTQAKTIWIVIGIIILGLLLVRTFPIFTVFEPKASSFDKNSPNEIIVTLDEPIVNISVSGILDSEFSSSNYCVGCGWTGNEGEQYCSKSPSEACSGGTPSSCLGCCGVGNYQCVKSVRVPLTYVELKASNYSIYSCSNCVIESRFYSIDFNEQIPLICKGQGSSNVIYGCIGKESYTSCESGGWDSKDELNSLNCDLSEMLACRDYTPSGQCKIPITINAGKVRSFEVLFQVGRPNCFVNWQCNEWSSCNNSIQTRTCTDLRQCNDPRGKPSETRSCTIPLIINETQQINQTINLTQTINDTFDITDIFKEPIQKSTILTSSFKDINPIFFIILGVIIFLIIIGGNRKE